MQSLTKDRKIFAAILITTLCAFVGVWAEQILSWGRPVTGLQISIAVNREQRDDAQFRIDFHNISKADLKLNMGIRLGNDTQYPMAVVLIVTDPHGKTERFGIGAPPIAGRVYPYVLTLPPGATFSIPFGFHRYLGPVQTPTTPVSPHILTLGSYPFGATRYLGPGVYSIRAEFGGTGAGRQGFDCRSVNPKGDCWTGNIISNQLRVELPSYVAAAEFAP